jgi:RHS repeat-associated protein
LQNYLDKGKLGKATFNKFVGITYEEASKIIAEDEDQTATSKETDAQRAPTPPAPIYYYHPDHLGSSTFLTDANGIAYQFFLNLPFGETMAEQKPSSYYATPYKFNGKELDEETGLYYYGARYYDPKMSLWLSVDPLAEKFPSHSPYNYCLNNPINLIDPDGRSPEGPGDEIDPSDPAVFWSFTLGWIGDARAGVKNLTSRAIGSDKRYAGDGFFSTFEIQKKESQTIAGDIFDSTVGLVTARYGLKGNVLCENIGPGAVSETKSLIRFGNEVETVESLAIQAAKAEAAGFPHGVSTMLKNKVKGSDLLHKSALMNDVKKAFKVIQTGNNKKHYTVELPKPVTKESTKVFNKLFDPKLIKIKKVK